MTRKVKAGAVTVAGVAVSNPDKILYPAAGFTKRDVVDYYLRVSGVLLPHLENRPVTLKRYPDGPGRPAFYEKNAPSFTPKWIKTTPVPRAAGGPDINYIVIEDRRTLVWCASMAALELHPFLHRARDLERPTLAVFDLDPGDGADILTCATVAFLMKDVLERLGLRPFPKVSGSKGIQLYIPLNTPVTYEVTQPFAKTLAELLERQHPRLIVADMAKSKRANKVLLDWSQNAAHKTTIAVYSLRGSRPRPFVSLPVTWDELARALKKKDGEGLHFDPAAALRRVRTLGDLYSPVLTLKQTLPQEFTREITIAKPAPQPARGASRAAGASRSVTMPSRSRQGSRRRFVIHKHAAGALHYDLRLEIDGVLKSWTMEHGLPLERGEKRAATVTDDRPLAYLQFEGTTARRRDGGTSMVWDIGTYEIIEGSYRTGSIRLSLQGRRIAGEWTLTRAAGPTSWLITKTGSARRASAARPDDVSALTGQTMTSIATRVLGVDLGALPAARAAFIAPMRATLVTALPEGDHWHYEVKFDGYRALAVKTKAGVSLRSRNDHSLNARFPDVVHALQSVEDGCVLDGEVVALDAKGRPSFNRLQNWRGGSTTLRYYVFDLLVYRERAVWRLPLVERRKLLAAVLAASVDPIRCSETLAGTPARLVKLAQDEGLEGLVAKRMHSVYQPGKRSDAWVKVKVSRGQEFVIGGYIPGGRTFDALLVGYYEDDRLRFIAKVRNGFVAETKAQVFRRFAGLETDTCPFANLPEPKSARRGRALTAQVMRECRWLKPELVAQVAFADWTDANHLRHARFVGLRTDKDARDVVQERAA
jgi:bifunctional non-homologous end joining protein LigD